MIVEHYELKMELTDKDGKTWDVRTFANRERSESLGDLMNNVFCKYPEYEITYIEPHLLKITSGNDELAVWSNILEDLEKIA